MNNDKNEALKTIETIVRSIKPWKILLALVLASAMFAPHPVQASCPAPGTAMPGALNMLHDATMFTIPMTHDAPQGNVGMFHAVDVSGC